MNITIPILVEETRQQNSHAPLFAVRALLNDSPTGTGEHLSRAINKLATELRKHLDGLGRLPRHDALLPWTFNPTLTEQQLKGRLSLRRGTADVRALVVSFEALGRRIAMMPALPHRWFEILRGQKVLDRAREVVVDHLNEHEKENEALAIPPELKPFGRQWVTTMELDVELDPEFKTQEASFFAMLGAAEKMSGREELHKVGRCLDWLYPDDLERASLRDEEVDEMERLLSAKDKRPVVLIGPPRVGKTAVVHECVYRRVQSAAGSKQEKKHVWLLSPQRLISGMSYVGQWEGRVLAIFKETIRHDHVLYFDDVLGLYFAGLSRDSDLTVAHVLKPYIERREFRVLAEMTPEAFRILQERDRGMADLFHVIPLRTPTPPQTRQILINFMRKMEGQYYCRFELDALPQIMEISERYQRDYSEPGKSALLFRQLATKNATKDITRQIVLESFQASSGLSMAFLNSQTRLKREDVIASLRKQVTGQDEAVNAMADVVCIAKARLNDPGRPLATFLFLGPTGVGKTQCAKALASFLFGDEKRLLRFDMNEYVDGRAASRLNGDVRDPEGLLTAAIRRQPFSVVLLDEIEKAHPAVFDLLLQLLGEGRLTDALGRTADFSNAIVIMTSNLGSREAGAQFGLRPADRSDRDVYTAAAEQFFRPEFINRLDRVVPFEPLSRTQIADIANRLIADVFKRDGLVHRRCILNVEPAAMEKVVDQGYHPQLGARALKRVIERQLAQPLAARLAAMTPDAPVVIRLYTGNNGIASHLQPLVYAQRRPLIPATLDLKDWEDVLDRVEDAIDRIMAAAAGGGGPGHLVQGTLSETDFRYLALREYADHLGRFVKHVDHVARAKPKSRTGARLPTPPSRKLKKVGWDPQSNTRELQAGENLKSELAEIDAPANTARNAIGDQLTELIHETALLETMAAGEADRCLVWMRSVISAPEIGEPEQLARAYLNLFARAYGFNAKEVEPLSPKFANGQAALLLEMPAIGRIMAIEQGTHLFSYDGGFLTPVQVIVTPLGDRDGVAVLREQRASDERWRLALAAGKATPEQDPWPLQPVVRLYDGHRETLDLRTGLVAKEMATTDEIRKFILAQLPASREMLE